MEARLGQVELARDQAQMELADRSLQQEALKVVHLKAGLRQLSQAYVDLGRKCQMVFEAQRTVVELLPDPSVGLMDPRKNAIDCDKFVGCGSKSAHGGTRTSTATLVPTDTPGAAPTLFPVSS